MTNNVILKIDQKSFEKIAPHIRSKFTILKVEPDDYELHREDETFVQLNRAYKKVSKELRDYLFNKRHK